MIGGDDAVQAAEPLESLCPIVGSQRMPAGIDGIGTAIGMPGSVSLVEFPGEMCAGN
jgi:hypothetical protein